MSSFPCTQCGLCCQHVYISEETRFLDRGDGTCRHYSEISKLCTIYDERPAICRVDYMYNNHYFKVYAWEEYVELNNQVCQVLKKNNEVSLISAENITVDE
ncbi:YkgJ family cysteine cluster protein [Vreelandella sulfidaeris]|uniref:YkgJ family cysteine cluster protein n=1 Tax=Vreelandella sulfidaeris TaxID=115553 RepID=UPI0035E8E7F3|tara:strand:- start:61 stop:363 length:303 start_codon:yes stop_codon:yes gene_type:complete